MTDTHTHIYSLPNEPQPGVSTPEDLVLNASEAGVTRLIFPNIDSASVEPMLALHRAFPDSTYICAGLHPTEVNEDWKNTADDIFRRLEGNRIVAVGEVGIDLYWEKTFRRQQIEAFSAQLDIAREKGLPVIIHQREALDDVLGVLKDFGDGRPECVFHSFTGSPADAERILSSGECMFGINGVATFKNANELREAIPLIGINRILLETDSPYLAPVPKRGRPNHSAYLPFIATTVAGVLGIPEVDVERLTDANASRFFGI